MARWSPVSQITGDVTGNQLVKKIAGSPVIAGTINGEQPEGSDRHQTKRLAGIMRLVEQAQQSKSNTQILADKAAGWLFYVALGMALLTAVAWSAYTGFDVLVIERVATVLVIACPHALGLAIPLVVAITTSMGARNGILVRDRLALEQAREIDTVIFDKTGTLTQGEFGVVAIATAAEWSDNEALALAAAIEGDSEHTIARGIRRSAAQRDLVIPPISNFEALKGRGVSAKYNGGEVYLGGPRLLEMLGIGLTAEMMEFQRKAGQSGQSLVHLVVDGVVVAGFTLADVIRPEASRLSSCTRWALSIAMLTGDA
jgi:Cu2+-exporting ATPase